MISRISATPTPQVLRKLQAQESTGQTASVEQPVDSCVFQRVSSSARTLGALAVLALVTGCASIPHPSAGVAASQVALQQQPLSQPIDNAREDQMLTQVPGCAAIVPVATGIAGAGAHLSVHGMGTGPDAMLSLNQLAAEAGKETSTVIYRDMTCTISESARDLAPYLSSWLSRNSHHSMLVETHSLGGRITLTALRQLAEEGKLPSGDIQLTMISPPLHGYGLTNLARAMPTSMARLIPGAAPSADLSSGSQAQAELESLHLPDNVHTSIYYGTKDTLINYTKPAHGQVAANLKADVYYLEGETHYTTVDAVAAARRNQKPPTKEPLPYRPDSSIEGFFLR